MRFPSLFVRFFRNFRRNQQGNVLIVMGASLGVIAGVGGLAIDMGNAYVLRGQLQRTADAAALAGVSKLPNSGQALITARDFAVKNMPTADHGTVLANQDVVAGNWDGGSRTFTAAGVPVNALRVIAKRSQDNGNAAPTFFTRILGVNSLDIEVSAVALSGDSATPCILALDPSSFEAFGVGNRDYVTNGCSVHVNSSDPDGISGNPNGLIDADSTCVVGGYDNAPTYTPTPNTGCAPVADPLASLAAPAVGPCTETNYQLNNGDDTIDPGVYCGGIGSSTAGTLNLNPGTYIIQDGEFDVSSNLVGHGVTIYLTGNDSNLDFSGGANIDLSASTTGELAGVLIYADRNMDPSVEHSMKGGATASYEGLVYMPSTSLRFTGNSGGASTAGWSAFIANKFESSGNGELIVNYEPGSSAVPLPVGLGQSKLVQ